MFKKMLFLCLAVAFIVLNSNVGICAENNNKAKDSNRVRAMKDLNYQKIKTKLQEEFYENKGIFLDHVDRLMKKGAPSTKRAVMDFVKGLIRSGEVTLTRDPSSGLDDAEDFLEYFESTFDWDEVWFLESLLHHLHLTSKEDVENLISVMSVSGISFIPSSIAKALLKNLNQDDAFRAFEWLKDHGMVGFSYKGDDVGDYIENWLIETKGGQPCWYRFS